MHPITITCIFEILIHYLNKIWTVIGIGQSIGHLWHRYWPKYRPFVSSVSAKVSFICGIGIGQRIGHLWHRYRPDTCHRHRYWSDACNRYITIVITQPAFLFTYIYLVLKSCCKLRLSILCMAVLYYYRDMYAIERLYNLWVWWRRPIMGWSCLRPCAVSQPTFKKLLFVSEIDKT